MQSQGKMNKMVTTLLTEDMVKALDMLVKHRNEVGIQRSNGYLFANQGQMHLDNWQTLQLVAREAGCKQPKLITSSRLRKYLATVCQVHFYNISFVCVCVCVHACFYCSQESLL